MRLSIVAYSFRTVTRGTDHLASPDPHVHPLIDPNYFANRRDLETLVRTKSVALKIAEGPYMSPHIEYTPLQVPSCHMCADRFLTQ